MHPEYDELLVLAETLGEVKSKTEKLEAEFSTQARPLEAATNALAAALSGIKALQFHVLDNNLGALSARVEEMRKAVDEQVGVIALELKKADETNAAKAGQDAEALRSEIAALQAQLGTLGAQFAAQLERVEFSAKEEAKKLQLIPGPAGAAGASLNPRGTFIDGETYNRLDVVSWLGSSYIAAVDGVTEKPSRNSNQWQVLASRGGGAAGGAADFGSLAGVAQINQGGTGQTTRAAGLNALLPDQAGATQYMLLTDGAGNVSWGAQPVAGLPSQTGNSGKLLTTNGTSASWSNAVTVSGNNASVTGTLTVNGNAIVPSLIIDVQKFQTGTNLHTSLRATTGNDATRFYVIPNGSPGSGLQSGIKCFGTDFTADQTNYDDFGFYTTNTVNIINSKVAGSGTAKNIQLVYDDINVIAEFTRTKNLLLANAARIGSLVAPESRLHIYESSAADVSNGLTIEQAGSGDAAASFLLTGTQRWTVGIDNSDSDKFKIGTGAIGAADRLTIDTTGNVVAAGSVQTSAPSGGTAAAWKLGTVATVSPTSPNRTIEVDIGGTIYYIHAKTTNN